MKKSLLMIFCAIFCSMSANAALTATATATASQCPATGIITVNASGGTQPYLYALSGSVIISEQASNVFSALPVGTYSATVTDNAGATITVDNIVVNSTYVNMNPTATAITEVCGGSNTGSIKLSLPSAQGTSPYTYQIVSGPTSQAPATGITTLSYTFQNLAPGSYRVSVTDACGLVQARDATLLLGQYHNNDVGVWAYTSADCSTTDYYMHPGLGTYYPHTYYAYPNGDLNQTPYTMTVTGSQLVPIPGVAGQTAFKWTLPTPAPWLNGKYAFKYTDICNTDVNSSRVHATTNTLGDYQISIVQQDCHSNMTVKVFNGWELNAGLTSPVTVTITPQSGGASISQEITDPNVRSTTFTNVTQGVTYNVTIEDICGHTVSTTYKVSLSLNINKYAGCRANIDGMTGADLTFGNGWQLPVTATFNSGPSFYHSTFYNQDFTVTYPASYQTSADGYIRMSNLLPGTYNVTFSDGCSTVDYSLVIPNTNLTSYNISPLTTGGCPGSQSITSTATSSCSGISANVRLAPNQVVANGIAPSFTLPNVNPGDYIVYYYTGKMNNPLFANPNTYADAANSVLVQTKTITVPILSSYPMVTSSGFADCSSGNLQVTLNKTSTSPDIATYSIEITAGQGDYYPPQTSNVFTIADYGVHAYKITDVCGNAGAGFIDVQPPTFLTSAPAAICSGETFTAVFTPAPSISQVAWTNSLGDTGAGNISQQLFNNTSAPITVTYTVTATSPYGCVSDAQTINVTVNPIPVITPSVCQQTICSGETAAITFSPSISATVNWTADDGTSGTGDISAIKINTGSTPKTITYTIIGVTSTGCSSQARTCQVIVNPAVATVTANVTQPTCSEATGTIAVTAPTGAGYTYSVDGTTYQSGTTFSGLASGNYNVTVKNSDGCVSAALPLTINAQPLTPAAPTASVSAQPTCAVSTGTITITDPVGAGYTYSVDGTNYQSGTTFSGLASGSYNVTVKNSDGCISVALPLTINAQPATPTVSINPVNDICANSPSVTLVGNPVGGTFSGSGVSTAGLFSPATAGEGSHTISYSYTNSDGCTAIATTTINVLAAPFLTISPASLTVCAGSTVSLSVTGNNGGTVTWSSNYFGLTGTGTNFDPGVLTNSGTASYTLNLTATAVLGTCEDKVTATVTVLPEPRVIALPQSVTVCSYENLSVSLSSVIAGTTVNWSIIDNRNSQTVASGSGMDNVTITNKLPTGSYSVKATGTKDGCTSRMLNVPVVVN